MTPDRKISSADQTEEDAANWLAHLDRRGLIVGAPDLESIAASDKAFAAWVNEQIEHRVAFLSLMATWAEAERFTVLTDKAPAKAAAERTRKVWPVVAGLVSAAAAVLVAVISYGLIATPTETEARILTYATRIGEIRKIELEDGSVLTLNTQSVLNVQMDDEVRRVQMVSGEALFDVAKDANRPFRIETPEGLVEVYGTVFSVQLQDEGLELAVREGRVGLTPKDADAGTTPVLTAGMVGYAHKAAVRVETPGLDAIENKLLWETGRIRFSETPLSDAVKEFNRYNETQLVIADEPTATIEIGGTFAVTNVEAFARLAETGLGLKTKRSGNTIELSAS